MYLDFTPISYHFTSTLCWINIRSSIVDALYLVTDSVAKLAAEKYNLPVDSQGYSIRKHVCFKVFEESVCTVTGDWITRHGDKLTVIIIIIGGGGGGSSRSSSSGSNSNIAVVVVVETTIKSGAVVCNDSSR
jgi:hypothetical protein